MRTRIHVQKDYEEFVIEQGAKFDGRMKSFYVPKNVVISTFNPFIPLTVELITICNKCCFFCGKTYRL